MSQLTDAVRLRASYSLDIRAGNMFELFAHPQSIGTAATDPRTGNTLALYSVAEGNRNVQPEKGETRTAGFVFTPFQGFTSSIDWYYIRLKDVINQGLSNNQISALCVQGNAAYCEDLVFGHYPGGCTGPTLNSCPAGEPLTAIISTTLNSDWETQSGLDFLADYRVPFGPGALDFNVDSNYVFELRYNSLGSTCDPMNGLEFDQYIYPACAAGGVPKFRATVAVSYAQGPWLGSVQARGIGAAHLVSNWTSGLQVDDNDIPFQTYVDLRLSYRFDNGVPALRCHRQHFRPLSAGGAVQRELSDSLRGTVPRRHL